MVEPVKLQLRLPIYPLPHLAGVPAKLPAVPAKEQSNGA